MAEKTRFGGFFYVGVTHKDRHALRYLGIALCRAKRIHGASVAKRGARRCDCFLCSAQSDSVIPQGMAILVRDADIKKPAEAGFFSLYGGVSTTHLLIRRR